MLKIDGFIKFLVYFNIKKDQPSIKEVSIHYYVKNINYLNNYLNNFSIKLRSQTKNVFKDNVEIKRRVLENINF